MKKFKFHFNTQYAVDLRNAVNDRIKQSIENVHNDREAKGDYLAWDRMCAAMDRLEDTLAYLNEIELGYRDNNRSAFDFYDFINNASVVIDCTKILGRIFRLKDQLIENIEKSSSVFGYKLNAECTDKHYFEYIRSLCAVHPLCTNHQRGYLNGSKFHCCPFVIWRDNPFGINKGNADLVALIYSSKQGSSPLYLGLYVSQFEEYLTKWIDLIPKIIEAKNEYTDQEYERLRNEPVKNLADFSDNVVEYLIYLKSEYCKRFDYGNDYLFDQYIRVFTIDLTDDRNKDLLDKYRHAIVYSLSFVRNEYQSMSYEGYDNTGIKYPDRYTETTLFDSLCLINPFGGPFSKYAYNLEKLYYLEKDHYNPGDKTYARLLLKEMVELINQYVFFTNTEPDEETIVLVELALYLESLTRKCLLNRNIPNDLKYRVDILPKERYEEIIADEAEEGEIHTTLSEDDLKKLLEKYGR